MSSEVIRSYSLESEFQNVELVPPSEMTSFTLKDDHVPITLPPFHDQFLLHRIENFVNLHKLPLPPHRKPVFDFIFVTRGKSIRYSSMDHYEVLPNHFYFLPAYQILAREEMSKDIQGFYCHFDIKIFTQCFKRDFINEFSFLQSSNIPLVRIPVENVPDILNIIGRLEKIYTGSDQPDFNLVAGYLLCMLLEIRRYARDVRQHTPDSAFRITQLYKDALSEYIYKFNKVSDFADLISVSSNYLNRCVTQTTGRSARDLMYDMKLLEAKVLLKQTNLSISEIAYKLDKKDSSDFSRFFRRKTGITPKNYRES